MLWRLTLNPLLHPCGILEQLTEGGHFGQRTLVHEVPMSKVLPWPHHVRGMCSHVLKRSATSRTLAQPSTLGMLTPARQHAVSQLGLALCYTSRPVREMPQSNGTYNAGSGFL